MSRLLKSFLKKKIKSWNRNSKLSSLQGHGG